MSYMSVEKAGGEGGVAPPPSGGGFFFFYLSATQKNAVFLDGKTEDEGLDDVVSQEYCASPSVGEPRV